MTTAMEHRLERYQDQQDREFATAMREPQQSDAVGDLIYSTRAYLTMEISRIEKHLADGDCDEFVTAEAWQERLTELKARLATNDILMARQKLMDEQAAIQGTIELHCKGLIKCNLRILDIEAELKQMEVS
jgi:hypothetical protein